MDAVRIDHVVLTVRDLRATCDFYARVLGMHPVMFGEGRWALEFGRQKINLHQAGDEFEPKARCLTPGSADFCLITDTRIDDVIAYLRACGIKIIEGPTATTGATGRLVSVYVRDPDGNLIEVSNHTG